MKNMTKNRNKLYTLIALMMVIGSLVFLQSDTVEYSYRISILGGSAIRAVVVVSMDLLTGLVDLFSLGQTEFMAISTYVVAIFTIPAGSRASICCVSGISPVIANIQPPILMVLLLGGLVAAAMVALVGIPILHLKSDYLAIATLGFSEVIRALIIAPMFDTITNGSHGPKSIPGSPDIFAIPGLAAPYITLMVLPINSSYGRAFKSIRGDEVATWSMGINLLHCKELSFVVSSFFTGVGGGMLAMFMRSVGPKILQVALTCNTLLIVVLDGISNVTGNVTGVFPVTAGRELLHFFDDLLTAAGISAPLFRLGLYMVIFSILLMAVVFFYSHGIMGNHEFFWGGLLQLIRGIPSKLKRDRKKPSSAKKRGIHR